MAAASVGSGLRHKGTQDILEQKVKRVLSIWQKHPGILFADIQKIYCVLGLEIYKENPHESPEIRQEPTEAEKELARRKYAPQTRTQGWPVDDRKPKHMFQRHLRFIAAIAFREPGY